MGKYKDLEARVVLLEHTVAELLLDQEKGRPAQLCEGSGQAPEVFASDYSPNPVRMCPVLTCSIETVDSVMQQHPYTLRPKA